VTQVVLPAGSTAVLTSPSAANPLKARYHTFTWTKVKNVSTYYLEVGSSPGGTDIFKGTRTGTSASVNKLPNDGSKVYATLYTGGSTGPSKSYIITGWDQPLCKLTSHKNGDYLKGRSEAFTWDHYQNYTYLLVAGTYQDGNVILNGHVITNKWPGTSYTYTVKYLPDEGRQVYFHIGTWRYPGGSKAGYLAYTKYTFFSYNRPAPTMVKPKDKSQLKATTETFEWTRQGAGWWGMRVGTKAGANNIYSMPINYSGPNATVVKSVKSLPNDGGTVYLELDWKRNTGGVNKYTKKTTTFTFKALELPEPKITNDPNKPLYGREAYFNIDHKKDSYVYLKVGMGPTNWNLYNGKVNSSYPRAYVKNLPDNGGTVYAKLEYRRWAGGTGSGYNKPSNLYTFTAADHEPAVLLYPAGPGAKLNSTWETFLTSETRNEEVKMDVRETDTGLRVALGTMYTRLFKRYSLGVGQLLPDDGRPLYVEVKNKKHAGAKITYWITTRTPIYAWKRPPSGPDLIPGSFKATHSPGDRHIQFSASVCNLGNKPASPFYVTGGMDCKRKPTCGDIKGSCSVFKTVGLVRYGLKVGACHNLSWTLDATRLHSGKQYLYSVLADSSCVVRESKEANNALVNNITLKSPFLSWVGFKATPGGSDVTVSGQVCNKGQVTSGPFIVYMILATTFSNSRPSPANNKWSKAFNTGLAPGKCVSVSATIKNVAPGTYMSAGRIETMGTQLQPNNTNAATVSAGIITPEYTVGSPDGGTPMLPPRGSGGYGGGFRR